MRRKSATGDPLLVPRIEQYAQNHSLDDPQDVAKWLRGVFKEYERKPWQPFVQAVQRAISKVQVRKAHLVIEDVDEEELVPAAPSAQRAGGSTPSCAEARLARASPT